MGANSTDTAWNFGQMGNILHVSGDNAITCGVAEVSARGGVFVAITFLEDSTFVTANGDGLVAEDTTYWLNDATGSTAIDTNGSVVTDGITFPAGLTIYGRWTKIDLATGKCIAYIGY